MDANIRTIRSRQYFISDGRAACGSVEQSSAGFLATAASGRLIGKFQSLKDAARSLPAAGAS
jgi:hypothetical protein